MTDQEAAHGSPVGSTADDPAPADAAERREDRRLGIGDRIGVVTRRLKRERRVQELLAVVSGAETAGGALLAAGLAFHALFAILPALLFLTGIAGWLIQDPERRAALVRDLVDRVPPLSGPLTDSLEQLAAGAGAFSLIGLVGLAWGASNFYGSLDEAMTRLFPGGTPRGVLERRIRGVVTVLSLVGVVVLAVVLGSVWQVVTNVFAEVGDVEVWRLLSQLVTVALFVLVVLLTYRLVPTAPPGWRAALPPAIVAGLAIGILSYAFSILAPLLVRSLERFGVGVVGIALFGALIWLNYVFTLMIFGAAWARVRRDRAQLRRRRREPAPRLPD